MGFAGRVLVGRDVTAELDGLGKLVALDLPGEALAQPGVRLLDLVAVFDALVEHAVVVADAVAHHRQCERRATVQEAGGEAAESAVTEAGVCLAVEHVLEVEAEPAQRFARLVLDAYAQQRIVQQAPHQEFERQVTHAPHLVALHREARSCPAFHDAVARREYHRLVEIRRLGANGAPAQHAAEVMREVLQYGIGRHRQARGLQQLDVAQPR